MEIPCHHCSIKGMCVRHVPVFAALDDAGFYAVHRLVRHKDVGKHATVFQEGDRFSDLLIVREGELTLYKHGPDDEAVETERIGIGGVYGSEKLFGQLDEQTHEVSGFCEQPTSFCLIHLNDFRELVSSDERIALTLLADMNERLADYRKRLYAVGIKNVEKRIAYYLSDQKGAAEGDHIEQTQESIGQTLFLTKETVNRKLKQMEDENILTIEGKRKIRILNYKKLIEKAQGFAN